MECRLQVVLVIDLKSENVEFELSGITGTGTIPISSGPRSSDTLIVITTATEEGIAHITIMEY